MPGDCSRARGGIDLGGTKIEAAIFDEKHNALGSARRATPTSGGPADVAREMELALRDAARAAKLEPNELAGVGAGSPGEVEDGTGRAAMEAHVRSLVDKGHKTDLFKLMREHEHTRLTSGIWAHALEHGDELAISVIDRAVEALGAGVASAVNLIDVEAVVIGGGLG